MVARLVVFRGIGEGVARIFKQVCRLFAVLHAGSGISLPYDGGCRGAVDCRCRIGREGEGRLVDGEGVCLFGTLPVDAAVSVYGCICNGDDRVVGARGGVGIEVIGFKYVAVLAALICAIVCDGDIEEIGRGVGKLCHCVGDGARGGAVRPIFAGVLGAPLHLFLLNVKGEAARLRRVIGGADAVVDGVRAAAVHVGELGDGLGDCALFPDYGEGELPGDLLTVYGFCLCDGFLLDIIRRAGVEASKVFRFNGETGGRDGVVFARRYLEGIVGGVSAVFKGDDHIVAAHVHGAVVFYGVFSARYVIGVCEGERVAGKPVVAVRRRKRQTRIDGAVRIGNRHGERCRIQRHRAFFGRNEIVVEVKGVGDDGDILTGDGVADLIQPALCAPRLVGERDARKDGFYIVAGYEAAMRIAEAVRRLPVGDGDTVRREGELRLIDDIVAARRILVGAFAAAYIVVFVAERCGDGVFARVHGVVFGFEIVCAEVSVAFIEILELQVIALESARKRYGSIPRLAVIGFCAVPPGNGEQLGEDGEFDRVLILVIVVRHRDIDGERIAARLGGLNGSFRTSFAAVGSAIIGGTLIDIRHGTFAGVGKGRSLCRFAVRPARIERKPHRKLRARDAVPQAGDGIVFGDRVDNMRRAFALFFQDARVPTVIVEIFFADRERQPVCADGRAVRGFKENRPGRAACAACRYRRLPRYRHIKLIGGIFVGAGVGRYRHHIFLDGELDRYRIAAVIAVRVNGDLRIVVARVCGFGEGVAEGSPLPFCIPAAGEVFDGDGGVAVCKRADGDFGGEGVRLVAVRPVLDIGKLRLYHCARVRADGKFKIFICSVRVGARGDGRAQDIAARGEVGFQHLCGGAERGFILPDFKGHGQTVVQGFGFERTDIGGNRAERPACKRVRAAFADNYGVAGDFYR